MAADGKAVAARVHREHVPGRGHRVSGGQPADRDIEARPRVANDAPRRRVERTLARQHELFAGCDGAAAERTSGRSIDFERGYRNGGVGDSQTGLCGLGHLAVAVPYLQSDDVLTHRQGVPAVEGLDGMVGAERSVRPQDADGARRTGPEVIRDEGRCPPVGFSGIQRDDGVRCHADSAAQGTAVPVLEDEARRQWRDVDHLEAHLVGPRAVAGIVLGHQVDRLPAQGQRTGPTVEPQVCFGGGVLPVSYQRSHVGTAAGPMVADDASRRRVTGGTGVDDHPSAGHDLAARQRVVLVGAQDVADDWWRGVAPGGRAAPADGAAGKIMDHRGAVQSAAMDADLDLAAGRRAHVDAVPGDLRNSLRGKPPAVLLHGDFFA